MTDIFVKSVHASDTQLSPPELNQQVKVLQSRCLDGCGLFAEQQQFWVLVTEKCLTVGFSFLRRRPYCATRYLQSQSVDLLGGLVIFTLNITAGRRTAGGPVGHQEREISTDIRCC